MWVSSLFTILLSLQLALALPQRRTTTLQVGPNEAKCLSEHQPEGTSAPEPCLPSAQPLGCAGSIWRRINGEGRSGYSQCQNNEEIIVGGTSGSLPPQYSACLSDHRVGRGQRLQTCRPQTRPEGCESSIWEELRPNQIYPECQTDADDDLLLRPEYARCHSEYLPPGQGQGQPQPATCLPPVQPLNCPGDIWAEAINSPRYPRCPDDDVTRGRTGEILPPGHSVCFSDHQPDGAGRPETCIPDVKPINCPNGIYEEIKATGQYAPCINNRVLEVQES